MFHLRVVLALWLFVSFVKGEAVVVGVIGDFGVAALGSSSAAVELSVANALKRWQPDFIVTLGDNNYPDAASSTIDINIGQFFAEYIHPYMGDYGPADRQTDFILAWATMIGRQDHHWRISLCRETSAITRSVRGL